MAKAIEFKFVKQIDCKAWKTSSTKVDQKGHNLGHIDLLLDLGIAIMAVMA